ncbi:BrnT family toxin [Trichormus sp. NMC-1]|uniref:BrnT family toxin n=1 Tax=Trichormus sp. NMC-1 TaxID=1853259 RepID=UPI0009F25291|nr:BrnT family toxin [Trichormus sp. NMC-1]
MQFRISDRSTGVLLAIFTFWCGIGFLGNGVAVVVWIERRGDVIRIISARKANRYNQIKTIKI